MQQLALGWLAYKLSQSAFLLGLVSFAGMAPTLLVTPFAGVLVDRVNRHKLVIITQTLATIQALSLAVLALSGSIQIWHLVVLGAFMGVISSIDMPARQAFMIQMIDDRSDLPNAIALNSSLVNVARLIGPTIAGILILWVGEGMCFLLNGISYIAVIWALCAMRIKPIPKPEHASSSIFLHFKEGLQYAVGFAPMRAIILLLAAVSLFGSSYMVLMPVFAKDIFHGGPTVLALLMAASGLGALAGALFLAMRRSVRGLSRWIMFSSCLFGCGLIIFSLVKSLILAVPILILCGFGMMVELAGSNTILQSLVDEDKRGRVMSLYTLSFMGMSPIGGLLAGILAARIGSPYTVLLCGGLTLICGLLFGTQLPYIRQQMRPVYIEKGIITSEPTPDFNRN